jgi:hypothetical protein
MLRHAFVHPITREPWTTLHGSVATTEKLLPLSPYEDEPTSHFKPPSSNTEFNTESVVWHGPPTDSPILFSAFNTQDMNCLYEILQKANDANAFQITTASESGITFCLEGAAVKVCSVSCIVFMRRHSSQKEKR